MRRILLFVIIGLLAGTSYAEITRYNVPLEGSPYLGSNSAPVTIVEFIDYQ